MNREDKSADQLLVPSDAKCESIDLRAAPAGSRKWFDASLRGVAWISSVVVSAVTIYATSKAERPKREEWQAGLSGSAVGSIFPDAPVDERSVELPWNYFGNGLATLATLGLFDECITKQSGKEPDRFREMLYCVCRSDAIHRNVGTKQHYHVGDLVTSDYQDRQCLDFAGGARPSQSLLSTPFSNDERTATWQSLRLFEKCRDDLKGRTKSVQDVQVFCACQVDSIRSGGGGLRENQAFCRAVARHPGPLTPSQVAAGRSALRRAASGSR